MAGDVALEGWTGILGGLRARSAQPLASPPNAGPLQRASGVPRRNPVSSPFSW